MPRRHRQGRRSAPAGLVRNVGIHVDEDVIDAALGAPVLTAAVPWTVLDPGVANFRYLKTLPLPAHLLPALAFATELKGKKLFGSALVAEDVRADLARCAAIRESNLSALQNGSVKYPKGLAVAAHDLEGPAHTAAIAVYCEIVVETRQIIMRRLSQRARKCPAASSARGSARQRERGAQETPRPLVCVALLERPARRCSKPDPSTLLARASQRGVPAVRHPAGGLRLRVDPSGLAVPALSGRAVAAPPALPDVTPVAIRSLREERRGECNAGLGQGDKREVAVGGHGSPPEPSSACFAGTFSRSREKVWRGGRVSLLPNLGEGVAEGDG